MESLIFLAEKRGKAAKARAHANRRTQQSYVSREEAAIPASSTEVVLITAVIEANKKRDTVTLDGLSAFVKTETP